MSREWQQKKLPEYVMPNAVYYQSLWAVRDLERMEMRLKELKNGRVSNVSFSVKEPARNYGNKKRGPVENSAVEAALIAERIEAIHKALLDVPEMYRECIMDSVTQREVVQIYPSKLWKIWKQKFLFNVAKNLSLM